MINENSAGAIIFRIEKEGVKYLLLYKKASGHYREAWDFPKGNIETGENEEQAAEREAEEETGLESLNLIPAFKEKIQFFYRRENNNVYKTISFFLAETKNKEAKVSHEHDDYKWCNYEESLNLLTHKNSVEILKKADAFLKEHLKQKRLE